MSIDNKTPVQKRDELYTFVINSFDEDDFDRASEQDDEFEAEFNSYSDFQDLQRVWIDALPMDDLNLYLRLSHKIAENSVQMVDKETMGAVFSSDGFYFIVDTIVMTHPQ